MALSRLITFASSLCMLGSAATFCATSAAQESVAAAPVELAGTLERIPIFGRSLEGNLLGEPAAPDVSIYLPPSYATDPNRRFPVVYMLHGYTNSDLGYFGSEGRRAHVIAERVFASGKANEMILVMPNCMNVFGGCMYSSSATAGDWESYIAEDLVAYMDEHYRTLARRESRGLAGHSMGGYGTIRIGMKRPDVFSALYALSSCCLNEGTVRARTEGPAPAETVRTLDEARDNRAAQGTLARAAAWAPNPANPPLYLDLPTKNGQVVPEVAVKWAANSPVATLDQYVPNLKKYTAIALDIGLQDGLIASNEVFVAGLKRFGVPHTYATYEGDHGNRVPQRIEEHVLPFFSKHLSFAHATTAVVPRIPPVAEAQRTAEQRAVAARFAGSGMTNAVATYLAHPALASAVLPYQQYVTSESTLPARHRALLHLRTAWLTRSSYLWAHHAQRALRAGLDRAALERIAHGPAADGWSAFEATLLRAADELHVDSFVSDATWAALARDYDTNQLVDLVYGVGDVTMHAGIVNTLGVALEDDAEERLPPGIPYTVAAEWTNQRLQGKSPRIAPLQPHEWTDEVRARLDPRGTGSSANVFATFARNPPADALRNAVPGHIRGGSTLSPRHRELLLMRIGVLCRSEYEWAAHMRAGKAAGMTDADVERIVRGPEAPGGDALETALLRATDELYRDDRISDETWAELAARLDTRQLLDVLMAVGGYRTASMAINSAGVQLDANMADFRFPAFLR